MVANGDPVRMMAVVVWILRVGLGSMVVPRDRSVRVGHYRGHESRSVQNRARLAQSWRRDSDEGSGSI
jgi:hypothetical protein